MKVKEILKSKGPEVFTIGENKTVLEAIKIMVQNKVGSVLVLNDHGKISGIFSERDAARETFKNPDKIKELIVKEVMTSDIVIVEPNDEIEYVETIMTGNYIRHLPVVENKTLIGIISIGDVVKSLLSKSEYENKYLKDYISGSY
jgi:CBS domain-containing protein